MRKVSKTHQYTASDVLTWWRGCQDIYKGQIKSIGKGTCKKQKGKKYTETNEYLNRYLLTKIMDNEASRAYVKTCQNQKEWHISQIDRTLKMLFEITQEQISTVLRRSR